MLLKPPHSLSVLSRMHYLKVADLVDDDLGHTGGVAAVAFSPDGRLLASAGFDAKVCVWGVADCRLLHAFVGAAAILSITWVANSEDTLICGMQDGSLFQLEIGPVR